MPQTVGTVQSNDDPSEKGAKFILSLNAPANVKQSLAKSYLAKDDNGFATAVSAVKDPSTKKQLAQAYLAHRSSGSKGAKSIPGGMVPPKKPASSYVPESDNSIINFGENAIDQVNPYPLIKSLVTHPINTVKGVGEGLVMGPVQGVEDTVNDVRNHAGVKKTANDIAGSVPLIGPALKKGLGEFENRDISGGLGTVAGVAGSFIGPKGLEAFQKAGEINRVLSPTSTAVEDAPGLQLTAGETIPKGGTLRARLAKSFEPTMATLPAVRDTVATYLDKRNQVIQTHIDNLLQNVHVAPLAGYISKMGSAISDMSNLSSIKSEEERLAAQRNLKANVSGRLVPTSLSEVGGNVVDTLTALRKSMRDSEDAEFADMAASWDSKKINVPEDASIREAVKLIQENVASPNSKLNSSEIASLKTAAHLDALNVLSARLFPNIPKNASVGAAAPKMRSFLRLKPDEQETVLSQYIASMNKRSALKAFGSRSGYNRTIADLKARGKGDVSDVIYARLKGATDVDIASALGKKDPAALQQFEDWNASVKARGQSFDVKSVDDILKKIGAKGGDYFVNEVLSGTTSSQAVGLMKLLEKSGKQETITNLRRLTVDHYLKEGDGDASASLDNVEKSSDKIKAILGPKGFNDLRNGLEQNVKIQNARDPFRTWVESTAKLFGTDKDYGKTIEAVTYNANYADHLARLVGDDASKRGEMGRAMLQQIVDDSTTNGAFGVKGAYTSPGKLVANFKLAKPSLSKLMTPAQITTQEMLFDTLNKAWEQNKFTLDTNEDMVQGEGMGRMALLRAGGITVAGLLTARGNISYGLSIVLGIVVLPKQFYKLALDPKGAILLNKLATTPIRDLATPEGMRLKMAIMGTMAQANQNVKKAPPQQ